MRRQFGTRLRQYIRRSKIKQAVIAEHIGVTPSAVSQMLKGLMLPSHERFDAMIAMLRLNAEEAMELQSLLLNIRSGVNGMQSDRNRQLFNARCYLGITQHGLAEATGISLRRIRELERFSGAFPTADEQQRLETVLNPAGFGAFDGTGSGMSGFGTLSVAETVIPELKEKSVMCISAGTIAEMKPAMSLNEFIRYQAGRIIACDSAPEWKTAVAVEGFAEEFGSGIDEKLRLLVVAPEELPDAPLYLCRSTNGKLFLEGGKKLASMLKLSSSTRCKAGWRLPVAEFSWLPGRAFAGRDKKNQVVD